MQEKLFNFLTIRHIHKSKSNKEKKAVPVTSNFISYAVSDQLSVEKRRSYLQSQFSGYQNKGLASLNSRLADLVATMRAQQYAVTPKAVEQLVQQSFGRDIGYVLSNSTYKYQLSLVQNSFALHTIFDPQGTPDGIEDGVRLIYVFELISAKKLTTAEDVAGVWKMNIGFDEKLPDFLIQMNRPVPAPMEAPGLPATKPTPIKDLQSRLKRLDQAIRETSTTQTKDLKPVLLQRDSKDQNNLLSPEVVIRFSETKKDALSVETKALIEETGLSVQTVSVDDARQSLFNLRDQVLSGIVDQTPPAVVQRAIVNGKLTTIDEIASPIRPIDRKDYGMGENPNVKPLGVGELKTAEQVNIRYEIGEIAHIENVLRGEVKIREHSRENYTESITDKETSKTETTENELESTDRHELASETQKVMNEASQFDFAVHTDSDFGPYLEVQTDTSYNTSDSKNESSSVSSNYAREVVEKAAHRIHEAVRERRVTTVSQKISELNRHELNNSGAEDHTIGIYRWLNKRYTARVRTHGYRMMYEFFIPEPSAFHIFAEARNLDPGFVLEEPRPPMFSLGGGQPVPLRSEHIVESTYTIYGAMYNVPDLSPPPVDEVVLAQTITEKVTRDDTSEPHMFTKTLTFDVPSGYLPSLVVGAGIMHPAEKNLLTMTVSIGKHNIYAQGLAFDGNSGHNNKFVLIGEPQLDALPNSMPRVETRSYPIAIMAYHASVISMSLVVRCTRTDYIYRQWQIQTYQQIMAAYQAMKAEYEEKLRGYRFSQGIVIGGSNPLENKQIQDTELKKHCMSYLTRSQLQDYSYLTESEVTTAGGEVLRYPEIDTDKARRDASRIQFLESAFEWNKMMYQFFPYFWSRKENWIQKRAMGGNDPQFREFLRAGAARVILAVRAGYEEAVAFFLQTGYLPQSATNITFDNSLFVDVIDVLKEEQSQSLGEVVDEWEVRVPTSLVVLDTPEAVERISQVFNEEV